MDNWEISIEAKILIKPDSRRDRLLEELTAILEALTAKLEQERQK